MPHTTDTAWSTTAGPAPKEDSTPPASHEKKTMRGFPLRQERVRCSNRGGLFKVESVIAMARLTCYVRSAAGADLHIEHAVVRPEDPPVVPDLFVSNRPADIEQQQTQDNEISSEYTKVALDQLIACSYRMIRRQRKAGTTTKERSQRVATRDFWPCPMLACTGVAGPTALKIQIYRRAR